MSFIITETDRLIALAMSDPTYNEAEGQSSWSTGEVTKEAAKLYMQDEPKPQEAVKFDDGKSDWSLMPFEAVEEINKVLEFGAKKYSAHNWKSNGGFKYSRVLSSLLRHVFAYMRGEDKDPESGLSHTAHAGCNIIFLIYYDKYKDKFNKDDRHVQR